MRTIEFPVLARIGNTLHAAWNDGGQGPSHIRLATSTNGGATWSLAWATSGGNNELQPALSASGGALHLAYYSIAPSNLIDVLLQDRRGSTVTTTRVTTRTFPGVFNLPQFDPIIAPAYMGDYIANVNASGHQYLRGATTATRSGTSCGPQAGTTRTCSSPSGKRRRARRARAGGRRAGPWHRAHAPPARRRRGGATRRGCAWGGRGAGPSHRAHARPDRRRR